MTAAPKYDAGYCPSCDSITPNTPGRHCTICGSAKTLAPGWHRPDAHPARAKLEYDLVPDAALAAVVRVLMFGATKHGRDACVTRTDDAVEREYMNAIRRHLAEARAGETADEDTGEDPLAHAIARGLVLLERKLRKG